MDVGFAPGWVYCTTSSKRGVLDAGAGHEAQNQHGRTAASWLGVHDAAEVGGELFVGEGELGKAEETAGLRTARACCFGGCFGAAVSVEGRDCRIAPGHGETGVTAAGCVADCCEHG